MELMGFQLELNVVSIFQYYLIQILEVPVKLKAAYNSRVSAIGNKVHCTKLLEREKGRKPELFMLLFTIHLSSSCGCQSTLRPSVPTVFFSTGKIQRNPIYTTSTPSRSSVVGFLEYQVEGGELQVLLSTPDHTQFVLYCACTQ